MHVNYIQSLQKQMAYYKSIGDKAMLQVSDKQLFWQPNPESNSIAMIVQHLSGNMLSRWTNFLTTDGEKENRNRDTEFEPILNARQDVLDVWEKGWSCFFNALDQLNESNLETIIYIRNEGHTVIEALNRQLAHYPYHIGQMVFLGKMLMDEQWQSLSIPKGDSEVFNAEKFAMEKKQKHFTDE
jgi:hypothetical protein